MSLDESSRHPIDFEDQSLFGTRRPRPLGVGRHLLVVLCCFLMALGLAIFYAEGTPGATQDAQPASTSQPLEVGPDRP